MVLGGVCACCGKHALGLYSCKACGSRCCPDCVDSKNGFCKLCHGIKRADISAWRK